MTPYPFMMSCPGCNNKTFKIVVSSLSISGMDFICCKCGFDRNDLDIYLQKEGMNNCFEEWSGIL